jgi:hypothetical protein
MSISRRSFLVGDRGSLQEGVQCLDNLLHGTPPQSLLLGLPPALRLIGSTTFGSSPEITADVIEVA